ncbi:hypothetical protein WMF04_04755 [Sorangium sp. So ce260]|uniref:hypothetical protein n=1 Tax=Sorangium sp. So ce260 TaxID=3133291 RepID=UPI003F5F86A1
MPVAPLPVVAPAGSCPPEPPVPVVLPGPTEVEAPPALVVVGAPPEVAPADPPEPSGNPSEELEQAREPPTKRRLASGIARAKAPDAPRRTRSGEVEVDI